MSRILIVDDDRNLLELLAFALTKTADHQVEKTALATQALISWREYKPDLVILDANMPDGDGFEVCRMARLEGLSTPVVMLTARTRDEDMAEGFAVGADDYVTKPFSPDLLIARINAVLRRSPASSPADEPILEPIAIGAILMDPASQDFTRNGHRVKLTPIEFRLLYLLLQHRNRVLRSDIIIDRVWGTDTSDDGGSLKAHIRHLREKVELDPSRPELVITVPGVGYMVRTPE
jgi:DNA-binding response OmpR family regulator